MASRRTALASVLTAGAVLLPSAAWYVVGSREAAREAAVLREEPLRQAREVGAATAEKLRERLEALRQAESQRPYYHYQSLYHDPRGVAAGLSLVPSPLSEGPGDPLIEAHFQVDAQGRITLPALRQPLGSGTSALQTAVAQLNQRSAFFKARVAALTLRAQDERSRARAADGRPRPVREEPLVQAAEGSRPEAQTMRQSAYIQNQVAADIAENPRKALPSLPPGPAGQAPVVILVGPLEWHAVPHGTDVSLLALREVITPDDALLQGFVIAEEAVDETVRGGPLPVRFRPGPPPQPWDAGLSLGGSRWHLDVDVGASAAAAERRAGQISASFRRSSAVAVLGAVLAGLALVALVWQSERLARQRSQLAAAAAHELRTPLAGLRMYGEMLAEGLGQPAKEKDYARRIAGEAERLGRVVTNLLGFTRLERGGLVVEPRAADLGEAVRHCVGRLQPTLAAAGAQVEVSVAADLPPVRFDPDALAQILQNLLDNAERYSRGAQDRTLRVVVQRDGDHARITVSDRGPGIPATLAKRLFRPFSRGPETSASPGLGLGLALVRALSRAHGGDARIETTPGGGASVLVTLPLSNA